MKQLSGIKVFRFGFLCYVALTVFLTLFFWGLNNGIENLNLFLCSSFGNNRVGIEKPILKAFHLFVGRLLWKIENNRLKDVE